MSDEIKNDDVLDDAYDDDEEDTMKDRYFTFRIGDEEYGIEIEHVLEVIGLQKITEVPDMPDYVKGVINLRGQVIPIIDIRKRFNMEPRDYDDRTCVLVVDIRSSNVGFIVDQVSDVLDIPESSVEPPPKVSAGTGSGKFIKGLGKVEENVKIILDVQKLLYEEDLEKITTVA